LVTSEIKTKRETIEVKEVKRLSQGKIEEIARMISTTKESAIDV